MTTPRYGTMDGVPKIKPGTPVHDADTQQAAYRLRHSGCACGEGDSTKTCVPVKGKPENPDGYPVGDEWACESCGTIDPWGDWFAMRLTPEQHATLREYKVAPPWRIWRNNVYEIWMYQLPLKGWPNMVHLSIKRNDKGVIFDWREMQRIKSELMGAQFEGVQLFPAENRVVDAANQYHMYVLADERQRFPFGCEGRGVDYSGRELIAGKRVGQRRRAVPIAVEKAGR
jgi:hypothetical protein